MAREEKESKVKKDTATLNVRREDRDAILDLRLDLKEKYGLNVTTTFLAHVLIQKHIGSLKKSYVEAAQAMQERLLGKDK